MFLIIPLAFYRTLGARNVYFLGTANGNQAEQRTLELYLSQNQITNFIFLTILILF